MRQIRRWLSLTVLVLVFSAAGGVLNERGAAAAPAGCTRTAHSVAEFRQALTACKASGGTIMLLDGVYASTLTVSDVTYPLVIQGQSRDRTKLAGLRINNSHHITVERIQIVAASPAPAKLAIVGSSHDIIIADVAFVNGHLDVKDTARAVRLTGSDFGYCAGTRDTVAGNANGCIFANGQDLTIAGNTFHDCRDCDFIRGQGRRVTITNNTFDRAGPSARCAVCLQHPDSSLCQNTCNQNNHVQIFGGSDWTIRDNHFGDQTFGSGQIAVRQRADLPLITGVTIAGNEFHGTTGAAAIDVSWDSAHRAPQQVQILNNQILSRLAVTGTSILLNTPQLDPLQACASYPWIAGNTLVTVRGAATNPQGGDCTRALWSTNTSTSGPLCQPTNPLLCPSRAAPPSSPSPLPGMPRTGEGDLRGLGGGLVLALLILLAGGRLRGARSG